MRRVSAWRTRSVQRRGATTRTRWPLRSPILRSVVPAPSGRRGRVALRPTRHLPLLPFLTLGMLALSAAALPAQWPGEVEGQVVDAASGDPVPGALVELVAQDRRATTDAAGRFRLRGLEPGDAELRVERIGYAALTTPVRVRHGRVTRLSLRLEAAAVALPGVTAAGRGGGAEHRGRAEIAASGARTAGEVVRGMPGVLLRRTTPGGPETVSVRGGGTESVLVLVDGVMLNDPVTGSADLSAIPADAVESVTLLRGAQSARYGPRASTGVLLIETRRSAAPLAVTAGVGSMGERRGAVDLGWSRGGVVLGLGGSGRTVQGRFDHPRLPGADERLVTRQNADLAEGSLRASAELPLLGGRLRARAGGERLERGLPGIGHTPSPHARHTMDRVRGSLSWRHTAGAREIDISLAGLGQTAVFRDPAPPIGHPYDSEVDLSTFDLAARTERLSATRDHGAGVDISLQRIAATELAAEAPGARLFGGGFLHGRWRRETATAELEVSAEGRLDRDDPGGRWMPSHALTLSATRGPVRAHLAHRSAFTPPALGDLFFREGVAARPNPELRPERVPSEWELGLAADGRVGGAEVEAGAELFLAHVRDMTVWAPDFRFVWSPRNRDVHRRGADLWVAVRPDALPAELRLQHGYARVTYDRPGMEAVQLIYRPRHLTRAALEASPGPVRIGLAASRVGARNPDPSPVNRLPAFWTVDLSAGWSGRTGEWALDADLFVERALDERAPFIHGFPDPGRRLRIEGRLRRTQPAPLR